LELSFADARVQDLCSRQDALVNAYGAALSRKICCRLALLAAAPTLACIPMDPPIGLRSLGQPGRFAVAVGSTHHLLFEAYSKETAAMTDFAQISTVMIIGLVPHASTKAGQ
jgi:hypothetical protein